MMQRTLKVLVARVAKLSWHDKGVEVKVVQCFSSCLGIRLEGVQAEAHNIES